MVVELYAPTPAEARLLLQSPVAFRGLAVVAEALPPTRVLDIALEPGASPWVMPKLVVIPAAAQIIGSIGFKSAPKNGVVEIGYGIAPLARGRGYATQAVRQITAAAFATGKIDVVRAETVLDNYASQRVLQKTGFVHYGAGRDDDGPVMLWMKTPAAT
jgi:RimJ/RimL family protein N-acetyltransferase